MTTAEIIDRTETALAYLEDGARETGIKILAGIVNATKPYRPLVDLATGLEHPQTDIGSTLAAAYGEDSRYTKLEPTEDDGVYRAPSGTEWIGCTDGVWRQLERSAVTT